VGIGRAVCSPRWSRGRFGRLLGPRSIGWLGTVSALAILTLLPIFTSVVSRAVQVGELRQRVAALHLDATWRCQSERDRNQRQDCLARLAATTPPDRGGAGHRPGALSGRRATARHAASLAALRILPGPHAT
jgi:hypothetical protein